MTQQTQPTDVTGLSELFPLKRIVLKLTWESLAGESALDGRKHKGKGYDPAVYIAALIFNFTNGGSCLADAERLEAQERPRDA
jgi:hypothetical protein